MEIIEVFSSVSGEVGITILQGEPCTFIRFQGCPVKCVYCDTPESWNSSFGYQVKTPEELIQDVILLGNSKVILTGGEPLDQEELSWFLALLTDLDLIEAVIIETSGVPPKHSEFIQTARYSQKVNFAVDYKLPSAKSTYPLINQFPYEELKSEDLIKFLIFTETDLNHAIIKCSEILNLGLDERPIFVFTAGPGIDAPLAHTRLKQAGIPAVFNVQIHKILGFA